MTNTAPSQRIKHPTLILLLLILLVSISGCTHRMAYKNADFLVAWRVDDYFDLTRKQKQFVKNRVNYHLAWHQENELPRYIQFIENTKVAVSDGIKHQELQWFYSEFQSIRSTLVNRMLEDATVLISSLDDGQVAYLKNYFQDKREELEERVNKPYADNIEIRYEELLERVENWVGPLSTEQKKKLSAINATIPNTWPLWYDHQVKRQDMFLSILNQARDQKLDHSLLEKWLTTTAMSSPKFKEAGKSYESVILDIDQMLTSKQRNHFLNKLDDIINKLENIQQVEI